ncbi:gluconate 2-dehydrogenase subunit 3 family protein [Bacilli bacterium]|uniref:gluconate 2-dehydrogenase subunit 3 family protein n=1 Tax=Oceanobacillus caeni TaxID=405946 RepID=UPI000621995B|nr:dehydrogenase [Bacilli bacterium VT-13-104]PZD85605.1 gluconate 2-dehydrogenase subunit 3 family protein [Bacilli bacterium]PZD87220.1 gluconate 2-dehydrogenase subunit 3 family protein [Bacilli bacterium]PZD90614.1 gluconate 2-dehydrogenase subunit 3 family protein [Bacilli bacterium]RCO06373.1 gluconate 2-dehydrogenase subunit 3 family protein [Bacilli bacterium]
MSDEEKKAPDLSRRKFIKNSGYVAGGAIGGGILTSLIGTTIWGGNQKTAPKTTTNEADSYNRALMYFRRRKDFEILSAATERIFPEDENGPGAIALGVPYFIDHQLAGGYGNNEKEYTLGPFSEGTDYQGYQSPLKRHEIFTAGIQAMERESQENYGTSFAELEGEQQDEILRKFEEKKVKMKHVSSAYFFDQLRTATLSGVYADPLYGGNANMDGWRMKEFPGNQMSYIQEIEKEEFIEYEPSSLKDHL